LHSIHNKILSSGFPGYCLSFPPLSFQPRDIICMVFPFRRKHMKRIGVDVGGTFTDLYYSDDESRTGFVEKVPSTPEDPSIAVVDGLKRLVAKAGITLAEVDQVVHGTTVAT